ncbi:hypothetical protein QYF36_023505 [Acer negundo]|nr:hypothetical protein QYF36_023505 [Acer negundo]
MINFMIRMVAGRPGTEDEATESEIEKATESEIEKKFLEKFNEKFHPSLAMNVCDFFQILRLIGYKGIEKKFVRVVLPLLKLRKE